MTEYGKMEVSKGADGLPEWEFDGMIIEKNPEWFSEISISETELKFTSGNRKVTENDTEMPRTYTYALTRDADGKITQITDEAGNITEVVRS